MSERMVQDFRRAIPLRAQSTSFGVDWAAAGLRGGARVGRPRDLRIFRVFSGG